VLGCAQPADLFVPVWYETVNLEKSRSCVNGTNNRYMLLNVADERAASNLATAANREMHSVNQPLVRDSSAGSDGTDRYPILCRTPRRIGRRAGKPGSVARATLGLWQIRE
jgi:hypothetical protein